MILTDKCFDGSFGARCGKEAAHWLRDRGHFWKCWGSDDTHCVWQAITLLMENVTRWSKLFSGKLKEPRILQILPKDIIITILNIQ